MARSVGTFSESGGLGRGIGASIPGRPATKPAKTTTAKTTAALKKSGIEKLSKIGKTTSEGDISYAVRHGKITKQEAAAIDPKNFKILLDNSKSKVIGTMNIKTGKITKGK